MNDASVCFSPAGIGVISTLLLGMLGGFKVLWNVYQTSVTNERDSYREMAADAVASLEVWVNADRRTRQEKPFDVVAPVVPEHHSPTTEVQQGTADVATLRARLTAAKLELGMAPRVPSEPEE